METSEEKLGRVVKEEVAPIALGLCPRAYKKNRGIFLFPIHYKMISIPDLINVQGHSP